MIKACIFDLDGVIVDTAKYHFLAWKRLAAELGFEFTKENNERLKGVSRMHSLEILFELGNINLSQEKKEELAAKKNEWYREYILKMKPDEILPGVLNFLEDLKKNKIKIALGSASRNAFTILERVSIKKYFDAIIDGTKVSKAKPNPEIFLKAAHSVGEKPENCVVFEDAQAGVEAAINAGIQVIGIGSPVTLKKANFIVPDLTKFNLQYLNMIFENK